MAIFQVDFLDDGGGGDNCSYKTCKAPVKSSPPTNHHLVFNRPDALPVAQQCQSTEGKRLCMTVVENCLGF